MYYLVYNIFFSVLVVNLELVKSERDIKGLQSEPFMSFPIKMATHFYYFMGCKTSMLLY